MDEVTMNKNIITTMEKRQDFKFVASISKMGYATKQDVINTLGRENRKKYGTESLRFAERTVTVDEIVDLIGDGYAFCATFDLNNGELMWKKQDDGSKKCICPVLKDGYMSMTVKRDEFFKSSQIVSIDIDDTQYTNVEDFIAQLTYIPTFAYTSYSDSPEKRKFRLCYVMSQPLNSIEEYKEVANTIHYTAEQDTQEPISDKCGEKASQYFNGTNRSAGAELYKYYVFYDRADFPTIEQEQEDEDLNAKVKCEFDKDTVKAMETQTYQKFMHRHSLRYQYFYQSEIDWKDGEKWRAVDDSFVSLCYRWRGTGEIEKYKDGEHRRRKLKTYACLRRLIKPSVTPSELLFNLYVDRERFFDNSDAALTIEVLKSKVNAAFSMEIDEIKQRYSVVLEKNRRKIVLNPTFIKDNQHLNKLGVGENLQAIVRKAVKEVNYAAIDEFYNSELSVSENLKNLQDNGVKVCKMTLYNYCKDRGICTSSKLREQRNVEQIISLLDVNLSVRKNLEVVKANGIRVGDKKIQKLLKQLKGESVANEGNEVSGTINNVSGSYCPQDRVTDTNTSDIVYNNTIIYKDCTNDYTSTIPTQNDIISDFEEELARLEADSYFKEVTVNETEEDMELKLKTPSFGDIAEEEREFNNDNNEQDTNTDDIRGWKFDFGVFGRSNSQSI